MIELAKIGRHFGITHICVSGNRNFEGIQKPDELAQ